MWFSVLLILPFSFIYSTQSVVLKTPMNNHFPQIAVLGCDSQKANLYFNIQREVWVEDVHSPCVNNEENILKFCQKAYPSLEIGNIVRLDTVVRFDNWCELIPSINDSVPRCKTSQQAEETIQPYRCLHTNSEREDSLPLTIDCSRHSILGPRKCLRSDKWEQIASLDCSNRSMILSSSLKTLTWCGLGEFRGIEYICCPLKGNENDYQTNLDEQDKTRLTEDDPIQEFLLVPQNTTVETDRRILAKSHSSSAEPDWMQDYHQWNSETNSFADDDDPDEMKFSPKRQSHLTINEHERFSRDKEAFKRNYQQQIEQVKLQWQQRQAEIQILANRSPIEAQNDYEKADREFRQKYDSLKQTATRERTRINELHEHNLDQALDIAKKEIHEQLRAAWADKPLKTPKIRDAIYNYLHVLLRDRIHLVNRYERLRVIDPEQGKHKRVSIHERLRLIARQINETLNQLQRNSALHQQIQRSINNLISEYEEVNQAAERLLIDYNASLTTNDTNRRRPLGQDENKIYPLAAINSNQWNNTEYTDEITDAYDDDADEEEKISSENVGDSDWDVNDDNNVQTDSNTKQVNDRRPLIPLGQNRRVSYYLLPNYLIYSIGCLVVVCLIIGIFFLRRLFQQRRTTRRLNTRGNDYAFKGVDTCSPEEKALRALQVNGYENPTYKFFEHQTLKC